MAKSKVMRDMGMNEPVSIELPAHVWLTFMVTYANTEWTSDSAAAICVEIQEALLDPLYVNERQAELQERHDQHERAFRAFIGQRPEFPPGMEEE